MTTPWTGKAAALARRIEIFVQGSLAGFPTEDFEDLALAIHRLQRSQDPVMEALTERDPTTWRELPAVPVDLFRRLVVGTAPPEEASVSFRTSGTTIGLRGVHHLRSTALYDLGAVGWYHKCVPDAPTDTVALLEDPTLAYDSSLSHMVGLFGPATWHLDSGVLTRASLDQRVRTASEPLLVATTAFALADWLSEPVPVLPPDSVLMVTGGFKGRAHDLTEHGLYIEAERRLRPGRIVTEYGMTELSSQLWGHPDQPYRPPPWLRVLAVSPATGEPLPFEQPGQLRFIDLCNLDSTVAIETMDEGVVHADGSVTLYGRLQGAIPRGCSLTVEEAWLTR